MSRLELFGVLPRFAFSTPIGGAVRLCTMARMQRCWQRSIAPARESVCTRMPLQWSAPSLHARQTRRFCPSIRLNEGRALIYEAVVAFANLLAELAAVRADLDHAATLEAAAK